MSASCASKSYSTSSVLSRYQKINEPNKCWNVSSTVTPAVSTDHSWEENKEETMKKVSIIRKKFHQDRKLQVKHLPRNVVKQEISQLLNDFPIKCIQITSNDETSSSALVTLENAEILDDWNPDQTFLLRGQSVVVSPMPTEMLLCVARIPFHYTEDDFYNLVKTYGEIKTYFLMISEKTGKSKGYGFVQYNNKEHALAARNALNDKIVDAFRLVCDWLDSSHLTLKSLHSKCLYVDKLPPNFRDMGEFRKVFAKVVNPPYCQIALKNGCPLDWGLVEYLTAEDAELAQVSCNNHILRNQPIRVVYYIPGVRAINLYLRLLNDMPARGKSTGLLPDPTGQATVMFIQNLSKQNPIFAQSLKNIILHQIQESKLPKEEDVQQNSANGKLAEPKNMDRLIQKQSNKSEVMEKIIPSPPPIVSTLPILSASNGCGNFIPVSQAVSILPNTAIPPPVVEKVALNQPLTINLKEKSHSMNSQLFWNDLIGQTFPNGTFPSLVPALPIESPTPFTMTPPPQIPPNFVHEIMNLPLNIQQNIMNFINGSASIPPSVLSMPSVGAVAPPVSNIFPTLNPTIDPSWTFPSTTETILSTQLPQSFLTMPVAPKTVLPNSWTSIPTFIPPSAIPTMFTTDWQPSTVANGIPSQPSTPIIAHAGQKRKLLPSPEKSPEGSYIGQHSQGIGGHYADSYFKKKKMF